MVKYYIINNLLSSKLLFNSYIIKIAIKMKKILIIRLIIDINKLIYMQKLKYIFHYIKNIDIVIFFNLKKKYFI